MREGWRHFWQIALPGLVVTAFGAAVWLGLIGEGVLRSASAGSQGAQMAAAGWLFFLVIASTVATIFLGAISRRSDHQTLSGRELFAGSGLMADLVGVLLLICGVGGGLFGWMSLLKLYAVIASWILLWASVSFFLRRFGSAASAAISLTLSAGLIASPVILLPLARAAGQWGPTGDLAWQRRLVEVIRHGCPLPAVLDAARPAISIPWAELPRVYEMTTLGHEIPMELPNAWLSAGIYAGLAVLVGALGKLLSRRRDIQREPLAAASMRE